MPTPNYFAPNYFAPNYFAPNYFTGESLTEEPIFEVSTPTIIPRSRGALAISPSVASEPEKSLVLFVQIEDGLDEAEEELLMLFDLATDI